ncbi:putative membrane protein, partial [Lachnellula suecica]
MSTRIIEENPNRHSSPWSPSRQNGSTSSFEEKRDEPVTWRSLPHRDQLMLLTLARLSEPLVQTSLQVYLFYQLKSFDENLSDSVIVTQAGFIASGFTGAQFLTGMIWGRLSDSEKVGRKMVLLVGLLGTSVSCLGFGFSQTFWQAMVFRTISGAFNGNVGVMRTMVSEIVQEKKYQAKAFIIFPMCYNIFVIIGPVLGGLLANPAENYPDLLGHIGWLKKYPYAPPSLLAAIILLCSAIAIFLGMAETLDSLRRREDLSSKCGRKLMEILRQCKPSNASHQYALISDDSHSQASSDEDIEISLTSPYTLSPRSFIHEKNDNHSRKQQLPFRRMFTYNVICTLAAHTLLVTHSGTFNSLWYIFLSTPTTTTSQTTQRRLPFIFTGGLGMSPRDIGFAMSILGVIGILMQLFVYGPVNAKIGVLKSWRVFLCCFPVAYFLAPYLAIVPSSSPPPAAKDGILIWLGLCLVLFIQVTGRTFALPASTILVNNASPHPSVLGTMHGIAQSLTSAGKTIGPSLAGLLYGMGLD